MYHIVNPVIESNMQTSSFPFSLQKWSDFLIVPKDAECSETCMPKQFSDFIRSTKFVFYVSGTWRFPTKTFDEKKYCSDLDENYFGYVSEDFKDFF